jgi:hypothetical protein
MAATAIFLAVSSVISAPYGGGLVRGPELRALVDLVDAAGPRDGHRRDVLDPARSRRHHDDAVGEGDRLHEIVRDEHDGLARRRPERQELLLEEQPGLRVERAERLVHEDEGGVVEERAGDVRPLPHAARELVRVVVLESLESDLLDQRTGAPAALDGRNAAKLERDPDVLGERAPGEEVVPLGDVPDRRGDSRDRMSTEEDPPPAGPREAHGQVEECRLATARGADDRDKLPLRHREVDGVERQHPLAAGVELLADALDREE